MSKSPPERVNLSQEIRQMKSEPLLPVEKQLICWSLGLGILLLGLLMWVSRTFFPG